MSRPAIVIRDGVFAVLGVLVRVADAGADRLLRILLRRRRRRLGSADPAGFSGVQAVINHLQQRDDAVRLDLACHLHDLPSDEKDRLIEVLVMTLRVEAKKDRVRRRAIAILGKRVRDAGNRLCRFPL